MNISPILIGQNVVKEVVLQPQMGVRSLWKILKPSAKRAVPSDMKLAIDASIWIHHYKYLRDDEIVYFLSKRIIKLLYHRIQPIFVFDGKAPEIKRRAIELRRNEKVCGICGTGDICEHGMMLRKECMDEIDAEVIRRMESHEYNWGDITRDCLEESTDGVCEEDIYWVMEEDKDELLALDFLASKDLSKSQKLKRLVEMRERRKCRVNYNSEGMDVFSTLQIENVKKRNAVSRNIRELEGDKHRRIQGDCKTTYELSKYRKKLPDRRGHCKEKESTLSPRSAEGEDSESVYEALLDIDVTDSGGSEPTSHHPIDLDSYPGLVRLMKRYEEVETTDEAEEHTQKDMVDGRVLKCPEERSMGGFFSEGSGVMSNRDIEELFETSGDVMSLNKQERYADIEKDDRGNKGVFDYINVGGDEGNRVLRQMKKTLDAFNISYMNAPMEADSQCGFLSYNKVVDGVITDDNDVLLYGGVVYRNFFRKNKQIERYSLDDILECLELRREDLIRLSYMLGSDYTPGIRGIGPVKALESIRDGTVREEDIGILLKLYLSPVVEKISGFQPPRICRSTIAGFYEQSNLEKEKVDEILFFLDKLR